MCGAKPQLFGFDAIAAPSFFTSPDPAAVRPATQSTVLEGYRMALDAAFRKKQQWEDAQVEAEVLRLQRDHEAQQA